MRTSERLTSQPSVWSDWLGGAWPVEFHFEHRFVTTKFHRDRLLRREWFVAHGKPITRKLVSVSWGCWALVGGKKGTEREGGGLPRDLAGNAQAKPETDVAARGPVEAEPVRRAAEESGTEERAAAQHTT